LQKDGDCSRREGDESGGCVRSLGWEPEIHADSFFGVGEGRDRIEHSALDVSERGEKSVRTATNMIVAPTDWTHDRHATGRFFGDRPRTSHAFERTTDEQSLLLVFPSSLSDYGFMVNKSAFE
jgi:hypothetical protein